MRVLFCIILASTLGGCEVSKLPADADVAAQIVSASTRALYAADRPAVEMLTARARVTGRTGEFETAVWSARDGRARIQMSTGFAAGVDRDTTWQMSRESGLVLALDEEGRRFLRGHELHAHVFFPETRVKRPTFLGRSVWDGDSALVIEFLEETDAPLRAAYSLRDTLPLGFQVTTQDPDVFVRLHGWTSREGIRVFTGADFRQGDDIFEYEYHDIRFGVIDDSVFASPVVR